MKPALESCQYLLQDESNIGANYIVYRGEIGHVCVDVREEVYDWSPNIENVVEKVDVAAEANVLFAGFVEGLMEYLLAELAW